ncbi:MAG TPA: pyridoxal-phosphate dependent enzyme [bacterium]
MDRHVDPAFAPGESLILRYHRAIGFDELSEDDYRRVSLREGARILEFLEYKGVRVYLDDESTLMASGTFKSLEACFVMALCRKRGYRAAAFSSGANLGAALSLYGRSAGVETFFFHPDATSWKLDDASFAFPGAHVISVDRPERDVKRAALLFAEMSGIPHVPALEWRFAATGLRALFVFETMVERRLRFDWVSQTICAGFGPIGFYDRVGALVREGAMGVEGVPKFLGIQQEARSPMARAWRKGHRRIEAEDAECVSDDLLDQALYNTNPEGSYPLLCRHLERYGGELRALRREEYERRLPLLLRELANNDIPVKTREVNGREEIMEKAGIMALAGTLQAIDEGTIREGETVLSFFTGGAGGFSGREAVPECLIGREEDLAAAVERYWKGVEGRSFTTSP